MKKEEIHLTDWHRILIGNAPAEFLLEVIIRTVVIYLFLLLTLRLMGKRMGGQLTISELAVMLTLGAIVTVPMQLPDKGVLQGILVLFCALIFQRGYSYLSVINSKIERLAQGKGSLLVKDGVLQTKELKAINISKEQLLATLRSQQIYNLGEIRRVYLEACGIFSVFKFPEARPGLLLLPYQERMETEFSFLDSQVCDVCGNVASDAMLENSEKCNQCGGQQWTAAVLKK